MEQNQERHHLLILENRVKSLEQELNAAINIGKVTDDRIKGLNATLENLYLDRKQRLRDVDIKFETDIAEQNRQIQLAQEVLARRIEERQSLMNYLTELDITEKSVEDFRDFDWESLRKIAQNLHKPREHTTCQMQKAESLHELLQEARQALICFNESMTSTSLAKERFVTVYEMLTKQFNGYRELSSQQRDRLDKLQKDNERINILLRQSVASNEHNSDYVMKNVQAKCQAFLNSETPEELVNGLKKYKARQDRVIRVLRHKDNQLGTETNKLEVAKDQTHDQLKYYLNLIGDRRTLSLNRILSDEAMSKLPATGA